MNIFLKIAGITTLLAMSQLASATLINESVYGDFGDIQSSSTSVGSFTSGTLTVNGYLDANGSGSDEWDFISFIADDAWHLSLNYQNLGNAFGLFTYTNNGSFISNGLLNPGDLSSIRSAGTYTLGLTGVRNTGTGTYGFDIIVGTGQSSVPEPSILLLLCSGLLGVGFIRRKA